MFLLIAKRGSTRQVCVGGLGLPGRKKMAESGEEYVIIKKRNRNQSEGEKKKKRIRVGFWNGVTSYVRLLAAILLMSAA